jgi:hypothetical protein
VKHLIILMRRVDSGACWQTIPECRRALAGFHLHTWQNTTSATITLWPVVKGHKAAMPGVCRRIPNLAQKKVKVIQLKVQPTKVRNIVFCN